jgi:hypothetical protein
VCVHQSFRPFTRFNRCVERLKKQVDMSKELGRECVCVGVRTHMISHASIVCSAYASASSNVRALLLKPGTRMQSVSAIGLISSTCSNEVSIV